MSKISDAYEQMITRLTALLNGYNRLSNPYKIESNSTLFLEKGFGVALKSAVNSNLTFNKLSMTREFTVVISRKYFANQLDGNAKATIEKQIFEDQLLIIKDMETDPTLNAIVTQVKYLSDSGLQYVDPDREDFLFLETTFEVLYQEDLN